MSDLYCIEWVNRRNGFAGRRSPVPWIVALSWYESLERQYKGWIHHRIVPVRQEGVAMLTTESSGESAIKPDPSSKATQATGAVLMRDGGP